MTGFQSKKAAAQDKLGRDAELDAELAHILGWNSALEMVAHSISLMHAFPSDTRESFEVFIKQYRKGLH